MEALLEGAEDKEMLPGSSYGFGGEDREDSIYRGKTFLPRFLLFWLGGSESLQFLVKPVRHIRQPTVLTTPFAQYVDDLGFGFRRQQVFVKFRQRRNWMAGNLHNG